MRVVFFGTPELAVPSLAALCGHHDVKAVVCQPDRPRGRSKKLVPPPTKVYAQTRGVSVVQPTTLNDGTFEAWLKEQAPEVCVLVAYGRILKQRLLDVPYHGFLNMHPSLLPRHRGPSPIQTAILEGDTKTGATIIRLDAGIDSGDIVLQEELLIRPEDTTAILSQSLALLGGATLLRALSLIDSGKAMFVPQEHAKATVTRFFTKQDGWIRWNQPARAIHNLARAATPWPTAQCLFNGQAHRVHKTEVAEGTAGGAPGTVGGVEADRVLVSTGDGVLAILEFQAPGGRHMAMADFLRGHPIHVGDTFGEL